MATPAITGIKSPSMEMGERMWRLWGRRSALDQRRGVFGDRGGEPVFLLQGVRAAHGDGFLAQAGVQATDDFVLAEQLDHGVFHSPVQAHVVVQVQILLACQVLLHAFSGGGLHGEARSGIARIGCATGPVAFCVVSASGKCPNRSSSDEVCMSKLKTRLKCCAKRGATSPESTPWPTSFSSDVALRPAIPQGTIRSKNRRSVETL